MDLAFVLTLLVPVSVFLAVIVFCVFFIKCSRRFQFAPEAEEDASPTVFQLHVRKASQQAGSQTGMYRTSQDSRTSSLMPADEPSQGAGTQPILVPGAV